MAEPVAADVVSEVLAEVEPISLGLIGIGAAGMAIGAAQKKKRVGRRYEHNDYGIGTLEGFQGKKAVVRFRTGKKMVPIHELRRLREAQWSHLDSADGAYHTVVCKNCSKSSGIEQPLQRPGGENHFRCSNCGHTTMVKNQAGEDVRKGSSAENNNKKGKAVRRRFREADHDAIGLDALGVARTHLLEARDPAPPSDLYEHSVA